MKISKEGCNLLISLSRRRHPTINNWFSYYSSTIWMCYYCDREISWKYPKNDEIDKHGLFHLKESNLLPFI